MYLTVFLHPQAERSQVKTLSPSMIPSYLADKVCRADHISWRWCFFINLPVRSLVRHARTSVDADSPSSSAGSPWWRFSSACPIARSRMGRTSRCSRGCARETHHILICDCADRWCRGIDWLGCLLTVGLTVCLLLAMQWGGVTYAWSSAIIIALFVVFAVLLVLLCFWQVRVVWGRFEGEAGG